MQHTCGLSNNEDRNWFGASESSQDGKEFEKLVQMGLATKRKAPSWSGDELIYHLTDEGKKIASETMPKPVKLTRSQKRYQRYLEFGDCFDSFLDFCYWDAEQ